MPGEIKGEMKGKSEYSGLFKGRVETALDPLMIGRAKVRIPCLHGISGDDESIPDDDLPWASYCSPSGGGTDHGSFLPMEKGDYVWIAFENSDPDKPVILGGSYGIGATQRKNYGEGDYQWVGTIDYNEVPLEAGYAKEPTTKVIYKSPKGASILIEEKNLAEYLLIADRLGQNIKFSSPYGNEARRRELLYGGYEKGLEPRGEASIEIIDASEQKIKLNNINGKNSKIDIYNKEGDCIITLDNTGLITIKGKNCNIEVSEKVDIKANQVVSTSDSAEVTANNITMNGTTKINGNTSIEGNTSISGSLNVGSSASVGGSFSHGGPPCC